MGVAISERDLRDMTLVDSGSQHLDEFEVSVDGNIGVKRGIRSGEDGVSRAKVHSEASSYKSTPQRRSRAVYPRYVAEAVQSRSDPVQPGSGPACSLPGNLGEQVKGSLVIS